MNEKSDAETTGQGAPSAQSVEPKVETNPEVFFYRLYACVLHRFIRTLAEMEIAEEISRLTGPGDMTQDERLAKARPLCMSTTRGPP